VIFVIISDGIIHVDQSVEAVKLNYNKIPITNVKLTVLCAAISKTESYYLSHRCFKNAKTCFNENNILFSGTLQLHYQFRYCHKMSSVVSLSYVCNANVL